MAALLLTDTMILVGANDITGYTGSLDTGGSVDMKEAPVFGAGGFMRKVPGLQRFNTMFDGYADYGSASAVSNVFQAAGGTQYAVSVFPNGGAAAGDPAIFTRALLQSFQSPGGAVGDVASFHMALESDSAEIGGYVLAPLVSRTTSGLTGTAVALTGPTATQYLWAALHVTAAAGTNLVVKIQTDDNGGFSSATDRITFATTSAVGWQFMSVAGNFSTETHVRATATIASSTFTFAVAAGVK